MSDFLYIKAVGKDNAKTMKAMIQNSVQVLGVKPEDVEKVLKVQGEAFKVCAFFFLVWFFF